ncbi:hypothetical protein [Xenorhabdus bovienii]|uniref:hypothetical protein n=1 Tax=Xenorhabdus bovienii TaxID=40576 RepID=UPI003DA41CD5
MEAMAAIISYLFWGYIAVFGLVFGYITFPIGLLFTFMAYKKTRSRILYSILSALFLIPPIAAAIIVKQLHS